MTGEVGARYFSDLKCSDRYYNDWRSSDKVLY